MTRNSYLTFKKVAHPFFQDNMKVLEIGPSKSDTYNLKKLILRYNKNIQYFTADLGVTGEENTIQIVDEYTFISPDNEFDIVFSANVAEHVRYVWEWVKELVRITKKGGYVITETPANWAHHPSPYDCWRILPDGYKALYRNAGLKLAYITALNVSHTDYDVIAVGKK
jgi:SAM-dependent methyltransferase